MKLPTPRTDAAGVYWNSLPPLATSAEITYADFARELERENAILRKGFEAIAKKIVEDCLLHESHPIVQACRDPLTTFKPTP